MIEKLPFKQDIETKDVLRLAAKANNYIGQLKGVCKTIPNEEVLLNLLSLQEAQYSSEIENIITTTDDLYISKVHDKIINKNIKEVRNYEKALLFGFNTVKEKKLLTNRTIIKIQQILTETTKEFRTQAGTNLKDNYDNVIYTPPQRKEEITSLMENLEKFINENDLSDIDPLIKMAIIHHQFESIHPFYDGNGRVGRIINILYLCLNDILEMPILYLSRFIINKKQDYYSLLQKVRKDKNHWEDWIKFILNGVIFTSLQTILLIKEIKSLMQQFKELIREKHSTIYSQDLINALFKYPYTRIDFIVKDLGKSRPTVAKYLNTLEKEKLLKKVTIGRNNYYLNQKFIDVSISVVKDTMKSI